MRINRTIGVDKDCSVKDCDRAVKCRGLCDAHYARMRISGNVGLDKPIRRFTPNSLCGVSSCEKRTQARGLCAMHLRRFYTTGEVGPAHSLKKFYPEGHDNGQGYLRTSRGDDRIMMHRPVMEENLGRKLTKDENVHHVNGDRKDNRIENLELWVTKQPRGQRVVDKISYAKEILARYEVPAFMCPPVTSRRGLALIGS